MINGVDGKDHFNTIRQQACQLYLLQKYVWFIFTRPERQITGFLHTLKKENLILVNHHLNQVLPNNLFFFMGPS